MIFYFTATGNCLYVSKELDDNNRSIAQELKKENLVYEDEAIGIVSPVYGGELPPIVREFISKANFNTSYLYMVLTYGMNDSVAGEWAYYYGKSQKVNFDYIHTLQMVDNYVPAFDMNEQKQLDKKIDVNLNIIKEEIKERKHFIPVPTQQGRELYEMASRRPANVNNGSQITINEDKCVGCGMCQQVCPRNNFCIKEGKASRKSQTCEFCLACLHHCPQKAIYTSISDKNPDARFINEHIKVSEIIKANKQ